MMTIDYRDAVQMGGSYSLNAQALPTKKKNKAWKEETLDRLESIALQQLSVNRARFEDAYRIKDGSYKYEDVVNTSLFLSEIDNLRAQSDMTENLEHYGFIEPIINELVGEFLKEANPSVIYADDELSTNEFLRTRKDMLWERTEQAIQREIEYKLIQKGFDPNKQDFPSEEEKQAYLQQIQQFRQQNIPEEVNKYMNTQWKPIHITWAEKTLEESEVRFGMEELYRDAFTDYLVTGRCFIHWRVGFDYYRPERWSTLETFTSINQDTRYPDKGDYVGRLKEMTPNQLITNHGQNLSEKHKKEILRSKYYQQGTLKGSNIYDTKSWMENFAGTLRGVPQEHHVAYENAGYIQEQTGIDLGYRGYFMNQSAGIRLASDNKQRDDLIRVLEAYWVSYKRIGYLTYTKIDGSIVSEVVTDELLTDLIKELGIKQLRTVSPEEHLANPQPNTVAWDYVKEVRYGVKIDKTNTDLSEDLYLDGEPIQYQLRGESNIFDTLLPVTGILENTSLVSRVEIDQIEYSMCMNMVRDYMSKELGVFFLMDMAYIPEFIKDYGGEEALDKLMEVTRHLGLLPVDSKQARGTAFNHFQMVNMDLTAAMVGKMQLGDAIKRRAFEKLGLTPERMVLPTDQKSATGVQVTNKASYAQTGVWFDKFSKFQQRNSEMCINVAQWVQYLGKDVTVNFTDSDMTKQFIKINDPKLPMRRFKIYPQNNTKRRTELETLRQTYFQDNTIEKNLESMAAVIRADSISGIMKVARLNRRQAEIQQEMQQKNALQQIEATKTSDMEKSAQEHEYAKEIEVLKGEYALNKQMIMSLGFAEDKDLNNNGVPDVVEQLKATTAELQRQYQQNNKEEEMRYKKVEGDREHIIDLENLKLKERELETKKRIADKQLQIAETNKNRYDSPDKK